MRLNELEATLLGYAIDYPETASQIVNCMRDKPFVSPASEELYNCIASCLLKELETDIVSLGTIASNNALNNAVSISGSYNPKSKLDYFIRLYLDNVVLYRLLRYCTDQVPKLLDQQAPVPELMASVELGLTNILSEVSLTKNSGDDPFELFFSGLDKENLKDQMVPWGLTSLQNIFYGVGKGELCIIGARPGQGKTTLAMNVAYKYSISGTTKLTCFYSLEMSNYELIKRLAALRTGISSNLYHNGQLNDEQTEEYRKAAEYLRDNVIGKTLILEDKPVSTLNSIEISLNRISKQGEIGLVVIDYLQLISGPGKNNVERVSEISRRLKLMAKKFNCAFIVPSQLSRNVESRADKRPIMSDLRESGTIEQDADSILMIYSEDKYGDQAVTELNVVKNRHGTTGTANVVFLKDSGRFKSITIQPKEEEKENENNN